MKRAFDTFHKIDGYSMLMPDVDVEIEYEDIDDGGFDESGFYHRILIRCDRRKWRFNYATLTKEEFVYLRELTKGKETFVFSFFNESDVQESVIAYCNPVSVVYQSRRSGLYKNLTLEIVEC